MKTRFIALILALAMALGLTACGKQADGENGEAKAAAVQAYLERGEITAEEVTLRFLHRFPSEDESAFFQSIADEYHALHPNVTIKIDTAGDDAMKEKLRVMMGGGDIPDIFFSWAGEWAHRFASSGTALDLTPYEQADPAWKNATSEVYWESAALDGKDYGVPFRFSGGALMYNTAIFDALNLTPPTTWSELEACCAALKDAGYIPMAYGNAFTWYSAWWLTAMFSQFVPHDVLMRDYDAKTGEWTDEGYVQAIELLQHMQAQGYLNDNINSTSDDQADALFATGQVGLYFTGLYNFDKMDGNMGSDNWDWIGMPNVEDARGTKDTVVGGSDYFMVSSQSKHPEVAVDFLKFLTTKENAERMAREAYITPVVTGSVTLETKSQKGVDYMDYVAGSNGVNLYLDSACDARVTDKLLENSQLMFDGKDARAIMKEVQEIAKIVREEAAE